MAVTIADPTPLMLAMETNLLGHITHVHRHRPELRLWTRDDLTLADSRLPSDSFSKIAHARLPNDCDALIREAMDWFEGRPYAWWVGPCARPLDLEAKLERHGLTCMDNEIGMALDLAHLPPPPARPAGLSVTRVGSLSTDPLLRDFYGPVSAVLLGPESPMVLWEATYDGEVAATSEVFLSGDVAGIYAIWTRDPYRRMGIGSWMTWAALAYGRSRGASIAVLQASDAGAPVYRRLGFQDVCRFAEYAVSL